MLHYFSLYSYCNHSGLPVKPSAVEKEEQMLKEYKDLLELDSVNYPDPLAELKENWIGEKDGMKLWPPTMYFDMCEFLLNDTKTGVDLATRVFKDYKEKKGFSFLSSGFLFEVFYNSISEESTVCFLKAQCRPSQRINNPPHTSWIMIEKHSGSIKRAFCTCVAGRGQSCLHVTAILMKVDMAWQYGLTNPACTSTKCKWITEPKLTVPYSRICDMELRSPRYSQHKQVNLNSEAKQLFVPHTSKKGTKFVDFLKEVKKIVPDAVVFSEMEERCIPRKRKKMNEPCILKTVRQIAGESVSVNDFTEKLQAECHNKQDIMSHATVMQSR